MKNPLAAVAAVALAVLLLIVVIVGGWQLGWWMTSQSVDRHAHIFQHSYGAQTGDADAVDQDLVNLSNIRSQLTTPGLPADQDAALRAQIATLTTQACKIGRRITEPTPEISAFLAQSCQ